MCGTVVGPNLSFVVFPALTPSSLAHNKDGEILAHGILHSDSSFS